MYKTTILTPEYLLSGSVTSRPRSYLFTSVTVRIPVHTTPKCGTEPIQYLTLDFQDRRSAYSNFQGVIITPLEGLINLTPYSGVIFWGSYFNSKKDLKNSFSGVKITSDITPKKELSCT